ncbi:hypothetical protein N9O18_00725 [Candidatus Pelagibacter ubique]|nr:hypothetical protein [Candidatus Pelagibacter ubique]
MKQKDKNTNKTNKINLICFDCNIPLSNWDKFLNKKYPNTLGYILCSSCQKKREDKIKKELADSISDLGFYDYPKIIAKLKKTGRRKIIKI